MASKAYMVAAMAILAAAILSSYVAAKDDSERNEHYGWHDDAKVLAVQGVVLCQNATYAGTSSLKDARPLPGARVRAVCQAQAGKPKLAEAVAAADSHGYFFLAVSLSFDFDRNDPARVCKAALISSPDAKCKVVTNINNGKVGAPFRKTNPVVYYGHHVMLYSIDPLAYAPE